MVRATRLPAILLSCLLGPAAAGAASLSYYLNQSNTEGSWPDGVNYLQVTISDSVSNPGDIEILVTPLATLTVSAGSNFGIQAFGFNSTRTLTGANIVDPIGWSTGSGNLDGFGAYQVREDGTGSNRQNPLFIRITGISGDVLADYAVAGAGGGQGQYFFAAHVAGMTAVNGQTSSYFGGNAVVPVPAAAWLFGGALAGLASLRRRSAG